MTMHTREQLSQLIEDHLAGLAFPAEPADLYAPMRYALEGGGKRIRPLLVLMAADVFGARVAPLLPLGEAVEVFHTFTLLHDDIMDRAAMRRGKPAVHSRWGANTAILSGDVMLIWAYRLLAASPGEHLAELFDEFNLMATEVCEGQQYDMDFEQRPTVTREQYLEMIGLKTSALMARAAKMGAIAAGAGQADCLSLYDFGYRLGLAFQLQDDLLDSYSDDPAFGKKIGGDILEGKKSFLTVTAMLAGDAQQCDELTALLAHPTLAEGEKVARVRAIYDALDIRSATEAQIRDYILSAVEALEGVNAPADRLAPLRELACGMLDRKK